MIRIKRKPKENFSSKPEKKDVFSEVCEKHPRHAIEMFCVDCDELCCVICQATEHNSIDHKRILAIEVAAAKCAKTKEFSDYNFNLHNIYTRANEGLAENQKMKTLNYQLKTETEAAINKQEEAMLNLIKHHHRTLNEMNHRLYTNSKTKLVKLNEKLQTEKRETLEIRQKIEEKKEVGNDVELFIAMKKSQDNLQRIQRNLDDIKQTNYVERYKFNPEYKSQKLMKEPKFFGTMLVPELTCPKETKQEFVSSSQSARMSSNNTALTFQKTTNENERKLKEVTKEEEKTEQDDLELYGSSNIRTGREQTTDPSPGSPVQTGPQATHSSPGSPAQRGPQATHSSPGSPVQTGPQNLPAKYIVVYDYTLTTDEANGVKAGEVVTIYKKYGKKWLCRKANMQFCYIPESCVIKADDIMPEDDLRMNYRWFFIVVLRQRKVLVQKINRSFADIG